jgi:hypothetical protein
MLPELFDDNKSLLLLSQVHPNNQINNSSTPNRSTITSGKHLRQQLPLSSDATTINLTPIDYMPETS